MIGLVVHVGQKDVLEGDPAARRLEVVVGCRKDRGDREVAACRYQPQSQFVVGRVERNRQMVTAIQFGQPPNRLRQTDGRNRDTPGTDIQSVATGSGFQGGKQTVEVCQRFTRSHYHDVAEPFFRAQQPLQLQHLLDDLAGCQVPHNPVQPAGTENASHRTADLRADADGSMLPVISQQHTLDSLAIGRLQQQFLGTVVGLAMGHNLRGENAEFLGQPVPQLLG